MTRPNILFIMTDQQRADAMGCSGGWVRTPNLDRIASEGVRFTNCVTTTPVSVPARLSMSTGLYCHNTGVWNNCQHTMSGEAKTWMQAIRAAGYRTSLFGKTHLHPHGGDLRDREDLMRAYGLDDVDEIGGPRASARLMSHMTERWEKEGHLEAYREDYRERFANKPHVVRPSVLPLELYADVYVGQQARKYLESYDRDQPWMCWVSFGGPHEPWDTPEPFASQHRAEDMPPPAPVPQGDAARPGGALDRRLAKSPAVSPEEAAELRVDYAGNVSLIDAQIGEIIDAVEKRGELDNTVILFTSDHGEMNGDCGLIYKSVLLDGSVRVPFIVRTPETSNSDQAGTTRDTFVEWFDAGPTLAEIAGAELDYTQFAHSVGPVLSAPGREHRADAISEIDGEIMLLNREHKIVLNDRGEPYLLFDVRNDPGETTNLAGRPESANIETRLRGRILERVMQSQVRVDGGKV